MWNFATHHCFSFADDPLHKLYVFYLMTLLTQIPNYATQNVQNAPRRERNILNNIPSFIRNYLKSW